MTCVLVIARKTLIIEEYYFILSWHATFKWPMGNLVDILSFFLLDYFKEEEEEGFFLVDLCIDMYSQCLDK